jgi:hypothetical protein
VKKSAVAMLARRCKDGVNVKPLLQGFGLIFTGRKACRKLKKSLCDKRLCAAGVRVKSCK